MCHVSTALMHNSRDRGDARHDNACTCQLWVTAVSRQGGQLAFLTAK